MSVNIINKEKRYKYVRLGEVNLGEFFLFDGALFQKVGNGSNEMTNVCATNNGFLYCMTDDMMVMPCNVVLKYAREVENAT